MQTWETPFFGQEPAEPALARAKPARADNKVPWRHLAGLLACALFVFLFTFAVAMLGFTLGVGGFLPRATANGTLAWETTAAAPEEPFADDAPKPLLSAALAKPRDEAPMPASYIVENLDGALDANDIDWTNEWTPDQSEPAAEDPAQMQEDGTEIVTPDATEDSDLKVEQN